MLRMTDGYYDCAVRSSQSGYCETFPIPENQKSSFSAFCNWGTSSSVCGGDVVGGIGYGHEVSEGPLQLVLIYLGNFGVMILRYRTLY
jgi:hypothetical protein